MFQFARAVVVPIHSRLSLTIFSRGTHFFLSARSSFAVSRVSTHSIADVPSCACIFEHCHCVLNVFLILNQNENLNLCPSFYKYQRPYRFSKPALFRTCRVLFIFSCSSFSFPLFFPPHRLLHWPNIISAQRTRSLPGSPQHHSIWPLFVSLSLLWLCTVQTFNFGISDSKYFCAPSRSVSISLVRVP